MPYNVTPILNETSFVSVVHFANNVTNDWFGVFVVLSTFTIAILFTLYSNLRISMAFMVSTTISSFVALILWAMGGINQLTFFITLICFGISFIAIMYDQN